MAAKKVTVTMGFVPIKTRFEVAVDKDGDNSDSHTVCTGPADAKHDPIRVKQTVKCPTCETTHSWAGGFGQKGTERDGKMVVLTKEELQGADGTPITGKEVPVELGFRPRDQVYASTLPADGVHNVTPDKGSEKTYALLRDTLAAMPDTVGVAVWAPSSKNALWVLEVVEDRIVASKRCWPEDVRQKPAVAPAEYTDRDAAQFKMMVEAITEDFDLTAYVDQSRRNLTELIASKTGEAVPMGVAGATPGAPVGDLMAQIQATIDAKKKASPQPVKTTAKKTTAKKVAAKKVATAKQKETAA